MKIKLSTHSRAHNKSNAKYLAKGWVNTWMTPADLIKWVTDGKAWSGTHFTSGHRSQDNASGSNCIVFDFDGELQLKDFWATATAMKWCCLTYTSASSTPEVNRFRAVFPLGGIPLTTASEHKAVYRFIAGKLADELKIEFKDDCGEKPERLWFGNTECETRLNALAFVPVEVVQSVEVPPEPTYEYSSTTTDLDIRRCMWLLDHLIPPSQDGDYNVTYVPVTAACAAIGDTMVECWVNWVSRGHHGDTPSNLDHQLKWRGLGKRSGPASIFAMAKRIDINWRRALPRELQFNNSQAIFEAFVCGSIACAPKSLFRS